MPSSQAHARLERPLECSLSYVPPPAAQVDFLLSDLLTARGQTLTLPLADKHGVRLPGCVAVLAAEQLPNTNAVVSGRHFAHVAALFRWRGFFPVATCRPARPSCRIPPAPVSGCRRFFWRSGNAHTDWEATMQAPFSCRPCPRLLLATPVLLLLSYI